MITEQQLRAAESWDFGDLLSFLIQNYPGAEAFCYREKKTGIWVHRTTDEFVSDVCRCAAHLNKVYGMGKHIALCATNSYPWICSFFGIILSGNTAVPLAATMPEKQLHSALTYTDCVCCLYEDRANRTGEKCFVSIDTFWKETYCSNEICIQRQDADRPAIILQTSGVTNNPKYVVLSQHNAICAALNGIYALPLEAGFKTLSILPLHHAFELCCGLLFPLISGGTIIQNDSMDKLKDNLDFYKPDYLAAVPSVISALLKFCRMQIALTGSSCVSSLRYIIGGGAGVRADVIDAFGCLGIHVLQGYGLTETFASVAMNSSDDITCNTVGRPMRLSTVTIRDGEIWAFGPDVMLGYYKNPKATAEVLQNGWLRTGDCGYFDEEGHLIIRGRIKNVIVLPTGENVYPEELEEKLLAYDGIAYCKVYGENKVHADVYAPTLSSSELEQIIAQINSSLLMTYQQIHTLHILDAEPETTALGKPYRR